MGMAFEIHTADFNLWDFGPEKLWLKIQTGSLLIGERRYWSPPWYVDILLFYPEPHELRERLIQLEADPVPLIELGWDLEIAFGMLQDFVNSYEKAFEDVTPWEPVYLWRRDAKDRTILRDADGTPLLAQKEPIHYRRTPCIVLC